ncbi:hypothetical protein VUJ46_02100 [Chryseobacterium sp. MYb264]|uniref:hypothetical protein n=1 Tax=Chryseobacterium sp. MYb264 TaxID=2745153 RepID=UPI002E0E918E|nr:hypothetical protein VUJ46_02100 [Chryseobacterium sp. MYb264]
MKKVILILIASVLISCTKEKSTRTEVVDKNLVENFQIPDSLSRNSIFIEKNKDGIFRIWVQSKEPRGKYLYADTLNILKVEQFRFENNHFKKIKSRDLAAIEWSYFSIDSASISSHQLNDAHYLLLSAHTENMGKAIPDQMVQFWAINKNNTDDYAELMYSGYPTSSCDECIKGDFTEDQKIKNNKPIRSLLYQLAKESKLIYHPTLSEKNPNNYKNYQEKWAKDNGQETHFGAGNIGELDRIYSTYYKEDLFSILGTPENSIENDRYIIGTYFRGDLLAYDKKKKLYFPVIVESCAHFCNKNIELVTEHTLKITYEDDSSYEIDLSKIIFNKK